MQMATIEIQVPDIGDFAEVTVIELLVKPGDTIKPEQSLITVESDKASMEIPASQGGVVKELKVKLGDKVKQGSVVLLLEAVGEVERSALGVEREQPRMQDQRWALRVEQGMQVPPRQGLGMHAQRSTLNPQPLMSAPPSLA